MKLHIGVLIKTFIVTGTFINQEVSYMEKEEKGGGSAKVDCH